MPAGLLIGFLSWLASHLVVITLIGFAVTGLWVFGVIFADSPSSTQTSRATQSSAIPPAAPAWTGNGETENSIRADEPPAKAPSSSEDSQLRNTQASDTSSRDTSRQPTEADRLRKQPILIGGSLPNYDARPRSGDDFRPPSELPQAVAAPSNRDELFERARRAFWNGDFEAAESAYIDLIAAFPDDPDAFGELGNLYESMGKPVLAADAYFEAGSWLKRKGELGKLQHVIDLLSEKGDERTQQLRDGPR